MNEGDPGAAVTDWVASVRVEEDLPTAGELRVRWVHGSSEAPLSVSDLLAPRRAFWRRRAPAPPIADDRREKMEAGRSWHSRLIYALPREGAFEVRIRRAGISGRIDLLADVPVEVKTGTPVGTDRLIEARPDHVEQIVMYCGLSGALAGRIITLSPREGGALSVEAVDLTVPRPDRADAALRRRAGRIRAAVEAGRPGDLPACRWFGRRCEFQEARICDCTGAEPAPDPELLEQVGTTTARPDIAERWREALERAPAARSDLVVPRFRDLIYPRRRYFEATGAVALPEAVSAPRPRAAGADLYERLAAAVEGGPVGEIARLAPVRDEAEEEVPGFRGSPYLLRTSRAWTRVEARDAVRRFPQYALELGFRCAATGTDAGWVFLAFERAENEIDRVEALRYRFSEIDRFARMWDERGQRLGSAIRERSPGELASCPGWMQDDCPYRPGCACAGDPVRSQR